MPPEKTLSSTWPAWRTSRGRWRRIVLPKSKLKPVRRLEVFTGAGRRRTWTAEQKAQSLAESYESGEKVSVVARRHGKHPVRNR
jgi:Transposase